LPSIPFGQNHLVVIAVSARHCGADCVAAFKSLVTLQICGCRGHVAFWSFVSPHGGLQCISHPNGEALGNGRGFTDLRKIVRTRAAGGFRFRSWPHACLTDAALLRRRNAHRSRFAANSHGSSAAAFRCTQRIREPKLPIPSRNSRGRALCNGRSRSCFTMEPNVAASRSASAMNAFTIPRFPCSRPWRALLVADGSESSKPAGLRACEW